MEYISNMKTKDVHTEHCCVKHGCKYGDDDCTVWLGFKRQSYPCESCHYEQYPNNDSPASYSPKTEIPEMPSEEILNQRIEVFNEFQ